MARPVPERDGDRGRQRVWARPGQVPPGSGIRRQLTLMSGLLAGEVAATDFARWWIHAGARARDDGEGLRDGFARIFSDVFFVCDEFPLDLDDRAPDEPTEDELRTVVGQALEALKALDRLA